MHGQKSVYIIPKSLPLLSEIDLLMPLFGNFRKITSFLSQHASNSLNILAGRWVFNLWRGLLKFLKESWFVKFVKSSSKVCQVRQVRQVRQKFVRSLSEVRQKFVRSSSEVRQVRLRSSSSSSEIRQKFVKSSSNSSEAWAGVLIGSQNIFFWDFAGQNSPFFWLYVAKQFILLFKNEIWRTWRTSDELDELLTNFWRTSDKLLANFWRTSDELLTHSRRTSDELLTNFWRTWRTSDKLLTNLTNLRRTSDLWKKLDDGWPESVEEQGLLLLAWRHHITKQYIKDVL